MDEHEIINLLRTRDSRAIIQLSEKYGHYCRQIAENILSSQQDVEECLNDTYLKVWNAIPPACPERLDAYIGSITRNLALNRYRNDHTQKRSNHTCPLLLSELSDLASTSPTPEQVLESKELIQTINDFLSSLSRMKRYIFLRRYWYADSIADIAHNTHRSQASVSMTLTRLRRKLRSHLNERGINL